MLKRINEFVELKAYVDIFNKWGHSGFKEPINPFFWWNHEKPGTVDDMVHAYIHDGLLVVMELEAEKRVKNMLVFALCPQQNTLKKILDICRKYDTVVYNSEFRDRYRNINKKLDGNSWQSNGRHYYSAAGRDAWVKLYGQH